MTQAFRWLVVVVALLVPSMASAENFYAAIRGGPGLTPDHESGHPGSLEVNEFKTGFTGSAALGYVLPFGLRVEGELGYIYSPIKREGGVEVSGSTSDFLGMANVYYDVRIPALGPFRPYLGGGLGAARVHSDHEVFDNVTGARFDVDHWRTAFAYQARGGMIYDVNPWLDLSLGYRYVHIDGGNFTNGGQRIELGHIENHSVELGFAIKF